MAPTPEPTTREPVRGKPMTLRIQSRAVRDLRAEVEVSHLCGPDVLIVGQAGWLPDAEVFDLAEQKAEHERLVADAEKAEAALAALRQDLLAERQRRTQQLVAGETQRPRVDGERLIAEAEELAVAARARIVAFADEAAGLIAERAEGWKRSLAERDAAAQQALAEARAALDDAKERAHGTFAARAWLDGQGVAETQPFQVLSWDAAAVLRPPAPVDHEAQAMRKKIAGWS